MINRYITAAILVTTLSCSHFANAVLIRVSDGGTVNNLALETETVWDIDDLGKLQGAFNVAVGGTLWDVVFRDGSYTALHPNQSEVTARSSQDALDFSIALEEGVLVDLTGTGVDYWMFDSNPDQTRGCDDMFECIIGTPWGLEADYIYEVVGPGLQAMAYLLNQTITDDAVIGEAAFLSGESYPYVAYALWSQRVTADVPTPSTISILALGLIGLATRRFKKQS